MFSYHRFRCKICGGKIVPPNPMANVYSLHCPIHPRADVVFLTQEEADASEPKKPPPKQGDLFG